MILILSQALFSTGKNDWATPQDLFDELDKEFHFTLDPCATPETAKCAKFYTEEDDGLARRCSAILPTQINNKPNGLKSVTNMEFGGGSSYANSSQNRYKAFS